MTEAGDGHRPTVVFIGGSGRSGSTLLERMLGAVPGVGALGEVVHLPARGLVERETCACGRALDTCEFWSEVGERAFGGWDRVDGAEWRALQARVDRTRHLPLLAVPVRRSFRADLGEHTGRLERLYRAAAEVAGASVLIDSSKNTSTAFTLRHLSLPVRYVHLVRDSRGVAYSWTKEVERPETARGHLMPRYSPAATAAWWDAFNVIMGLLPATGTDVIRVRYEDLVTDPQAVLRAVLGPTGLPIDPGWDRFLTPAGAELGPGHSVAGNPMRFTSGVIPLHRDDAWRSRLPSRDRRIVTALTAPFLARYGYLGRRDPDRPPGGA